MIKHQVERACECPSFDGSDIGRKY
jgi:hypothetical protein